MERLLKEEVSLCRPSISAWILRAVVCTNWEGLCHLCSRFVQRGGQIRNTLDHHGCPSTEQDTINKSKEVEWTLGTTRQVLNRQLFSSGQDLQIVIVFIHSHAYCHCRCILSSITYILTAIVMGIRNIQKLSAYQIQS